MAIPDRPDVGGSAPTEPRPARRASWRNWGDHPIVAIVTVLASLLAIAGFFLDESDKPATASGCARLVGRWDWLSVGGVVAIAEDRMMHWYRVATDPVPLANGTWECEEDNPRHIVLRWQVTMFVDTLNLAEDGQRLIGANTQNGIKLSATRAR
ncbi:MAG: hypothetical protein ACT4P7_02370 [Gemmatimonadaceae bacterium]